MLVQVPSLVDREIAIGQRELVEICFSNISENKLRPLLSLPSVRRKRRRL